MKKSTLLKKAKKSLVTTKSEFHNSNKNKYICCALSDTEGKYTSLGMELRTWISRLLDGDFFYESWLRKNNPTIYYGMSFEDIQQARHQWLDWMIVYWEAKGE